MKLVIQYVSKASVLVDGLVVGSINRGYAVLVGIGKSDNTSSLSTAAATLLNLRIMPDNNGKLNRSILETTEEILLVPQFTLYAEIDGRRPSYSNAAPPAIARELFDHFVTLIRTSNLKVATGKFGAHMSCEFFNDGPVTIIFEN